MRRINLAIVALVGLALAGCASLDIARKAYVYATETTVPAEIVIPAANAFDILKNSATNYGRYCISKQMAPSICSASARRIVVKAVRAGTAARKQLETSVETKQPALASVYNVLVSAVTDLQASPAVSPQFVGGAQ
jgi:uncharacterized protein (DUF2147 family)